jgi:SMC interacting uncharacterized protein involved in chromosome segregation
MASQSRKRAFLWGVGILSVFLAGYLIADGRASRKALKQQIAEKEGQIHELQDQVDSAEVLIQDSRRALEEINRTSAAREAWFRKQLEKTDTATPAQLVDEGSRILEATDITTDGRIVTMSVDTWRKAVKVLQKEEEYRLNIEPAWIDKDRLKDIVIAGMKEQLAAKDRQLVLKDGIIKDLRDYISKEKTMGFFEKAAWGAGGYVFGVISEKIF